MVGNLRDKENKTDSVLVSKNESPEMCSTIETDLLRRGLESSRPRVSSNRYDLSRYIPY